ncbi:hypothetical protein B0T10DRAFT_591963 [Thelonectria olida]|uniref:Gfd2/YDR514C-like C-terminal domain-containing protein n=1 Tax=Thelonectria olida TaxID=1576542 RepID=A0A9P9AUQ5_9HYPO|nr:hypothetical protein B0T10DRAFT_591963 [Thelonectria olida]
MANGNTLLQGPEWSKQPGLQPEHIHAHIPPYRCECLRAQPPEGIDNVLPTLAPSFDGQCHMFQRLPSTEYILVALDFEELCMTKLGRFADGREHRFKPLTEIGLSYLDMRDVIKGRGQNISPGDRGSSWFRLMTPIHYIVEEYRGHWGHLCQADWLHTESYLFAFGKSRMVRESHIAHRMQRIFESLQRRNRTPEEVRHKTPRDIIFLVFDAAPVETTLSRLGLPWLTLRNVQTWDIQKDFQLELRFDWPRMRFEDVMEALGLRYEDGRFGNIAHCAGNAAVFTMQVFLALFYKSREQATAFACRAAVPWLRYTWVGHALDQANVAPGLEARRREDSQMNRHDVQPNLGDQ